MGGHVPNYPREYDLVVRVDSLHNVEAQKASQVMTGGKKADISTYVKPDGSEESKVEQTKSVKISDSTQV